MKRACGTRSRSYPTLLAVGLGALGRQLHGPRKIALELRLALEVLHRPLDVAVAQRCGRVQRPVGIREMRSRERTEIGAPGHQNAVDVIRLEDGAYRHRGDSDLVADAI